MLGFKPTPKIRVLMVCLGNICRSPTAEGVLRAKLEAAGLGRLVAVDSAGTSGLHGGEPPDARAIKHAAARGYDLSKQRARRVVVADFERFDWVLAMDEDNLQGLRRLAPPKSSARLGLLMSHAPRLGHITEVPDPYYGAPGGFDKVLDLVEDACDGLVSKLQQELGNFSGKA